MLDAEGRVTGTSGFTVDITERKQVERYRAARLSLAEEVAAKERLARERLEFLTSLNDASLATSNHEQFMRLVTARAVPRLGDWCVIHFIGEPGSDPVVRAAHSDPWKMQWVEELQERVPL